MSNLYISLICMCIYCIIVLGVKLVTDIPLRSRYDKAFTEIKVLEDHKDYMTVYWLAVLELHVGILIPSIITRCW